MNDFEWRRQLRDLRQPQAPRRDLWADIERSLERPLPASGARVRTAASSPTAWLFAAGLAAVTVLAVGLARLTPASALATVPVWKPHDPRLAGAAIELVAAQYELRQALQQAPNSAALQRLLEHTEQQESRLRQLGHDAG